MTAALEGGEWSAARPGRTLPPGKNRYPFYSKLGGPQGRSGRAENLVPTGIRSRIVQPVVSRHTDWATRPTFKGLYIIKLITICYKIIVNSTPLRMYYFKWLVFSTEALKISYVPYLMCHLFEYYIVLPRQWQQLKKEITFWLRNQT
jgi:hypothetical protein